MYDGILQASILSSGSFYTTFKTFYGDLIHQGRVVLGDFSMGCSPIKRIKKVPMTDHKYSFMVYYCLEFSGKSSEILYHTYGHKSFVLNDNYVTVTYLKPFYDYYKTRYLVFSFVKFITKYFCSTIFKHTISYTRKVYYNILLLKKNAAKIRIHFKILSPRTIATAYTYILFIVYFQVTAPFSWQVLKRQSFIYVFFSKSDENSLKSWNNPMTSVSWIPVVVNPFVRGQQKVTHFPYWKPIHDQTSKNEDFGVFQEGSMNLFNLKF